MPNETIFISYSRVDSKFVHVLAKELRNAGVNVWIDQFDIEPGTAWDDALEEALRNSNFVLVVLSKNSVVSQNVKDEYSYAIEQEKTIVPILLEECNIPFRLQRIQYADFTKDAEKGIKTLTKSLNLDTEVAEKLIQSKKLKQKKPNHKTAQIIIITIILLGILFWFFKSMIFPYQNGSYQVTVLVHESKGMDRLVLPNRGQVKMIYGDANVVETINGKGEATFKQIPATFFSKESTVEILFFDPEGEPYRAVKADSLYELTDGKRISLAVKLYGLSSIRGVIKNFKTGDPVEGVRVSILGIESHSDQNGEYSLSIPEDQQRKFQTIRAFKKGFEMFEQSNVPIQTEAELPISLKPKKSIK